MATKASTTRHETVRDTARLEQALVVLGLALLIAAASELIGTVKIPVGAASVSIFPMVWGIIIASIVSIQKVKPLPVRLQQIAATLVGVFVLVLVARLAFNIGPNLQTVLNAGPALLLQEVGHLLGTIVLALPLAVALKMGPATIGATFSIDREPSFAMVQEKYGPDSDQYRGVLAMYVFGTLFGAVFISLLSSVISSLKIFDPLALAMGAGVGSGSMMAAATASIVQHYPEAQSEVLGIAAVSNLITTIFGVYVGIWIALPLADKLYRALAGRRARAAEQADAETNRALREEIAKSAAPVHLPLWIALPALTVIGLVTASIVAKGFKIEILWGYLVLDALVLLSIGFNRLFRPLSAIVWITTIGAAVSSPWSPIGKQLVAWVTAVDFLSIATVILTLAGLGLGKDIPLLKQIGWKIIPVGLVAITASFILATIIAEFTLGFWG